MKKRSKCVLATAMAVLLCSAIHVLPQVSINAGLRGSVTDSSKGSVAGADVTLRNTESGSELNTTSDSYGAFSFPLVKPGAYLLTVTSKGYKRNTSPNIVISVGETAFISVVMTVGDVAETVTIDSGAEILQTQSVDVSQIVNAKRLQALPLSGKNFQQLVNLAPGVGGVGSGGIVNPSIAGARPVTNSFSIDGVAANDERTTTGLSNGGGSAGLSGGGGIAPNLISTEALQEFRVITSSSDATYGRGSGGSVNVVTRSGSNRFTGSLYEYHRNAVLDARNFFNQGPFYNADGSAKVPPFRQNLFGGTFGGRLVKDKHFFFGNYEGFRQRLDQTVTATVPNADLVNLVPGDLGSLYRTFYLSRGIIRSGDYTGFTALTPTQRTSAVTAGFDPLLFDGNTANGEAGTQLISTISKRDITQNAFLIRTDHNFSDRLSVNVRYAYAQPTQDTDSIATTGTVTRNYRKWQQYFGQLIYTLSSDQILEFRGGVNKTGYENGLAGGVDPDLLAIGVPSNVGLNIRVTSPALTLASNASIGTLDNQTVPQISFIHTFSGGNYIVRSGADLRFVGNKIRLFSTNPTYTFSGLVGSNGILRASPSETQAVAATASGTIHGLNGSPDAPLRHWNATEQEYFSQIDWRISGNVTLNLGLRYSFFGVYSERDNLAANLYAVDGQGNVIADASPFDFGRTQNAIHTISDDLPLFQPDRNNFQPRLGAAWNIGGRNSTVLRAGYGLYNDRFYQLLFSDGVINPPYAVSTSATNVPFHLGQPFPINAGLYTIYILDQNIKSPNTHRFNISVEQKLDSNTSVSTAYVAARGRGLFRWNEINAEGLTPQAFRPDSRFADMRFVTNSSRSNYDSLQVYARRNFAQDLDFTVSYTFARSTDDFSSDASYAGRMPSLLNRGASPDPGFQGGGDLFVPRPREADEGPSDFDVRHSFVLSHIYDLPFGKGKRFGGGSNGFSNALIGDWSYRGILAYRTGEPFNVILGSDINDDGSTANDFPRLLTGDLSGIYTDGGSRTQYLLPRTEALALLGNPSNVADPFDNVGRNAFRSPKVMYYDASLAKKIYITERINLGLELNAFNIFNKVNFAAPVSNLSSATFGRVTSTRNGTNPRQLQLGVKLSF